jgi:alpha-glucosidase
MAFDFALVFSPFKVRAYMDAVERWNTLVPAECWPCVVLNNHDQPRSPGRYGGDAAMAKALAAFLLTARGTPFVYYGEELGMTNGKIARREIVDPVGVKYWPLNSGRDPERTPMQWDNGAFAGFSNARPWLPVNRDFRTVNVAAQSSVLSATAGTGISGKILLGTHRGAGTLPVGGSLAFSPYEALIVEGKST